MVLTHLLNFYAYNVKFKDMYLSCAQGKINMAVNTIAMAIVWNAILVLDDKYRKPSSYK